MALLTDRVAIITGGAGGIGSTIGKAFAAEGALVVLADRDGERAKQVAATIRQSCGVATAIDADVTNPDAPRAVVSHTLGEFGRLDILVNGAGGSVASPFLETSVEVWNQMLDVNLRACFLFAQAAAREIIKRPGGRIINIASHSGIRGSPGHAAYAAAKGGLMALTRVMATELAAYDLTVNAIAPGPIDVERTTGPGSNARREAWKRAIPLRRSGKPNEIAWAALFLAAPEASYITGQTISLDGGFTSAGLMV